MLASLSETAQFSLNASACAVQLQELRKWFKSKGTSEKEEEAELAKITVNDIILYAVSRVLPSYQYINAHKIDDTYKLFERVHLGMAVDTPRGLMVPVIRNANLLSLKQISAEAKRLAAACQNGKALPDEITGSTFTVSNLGSFGITGFTPVINVPAVAILGVCGIELKPVESPDDECAFAFAPHIGFSLTINHQVVDGAPAARFLKALCESVENIYLQLAAG
jgi:pyruvate dehydrogenase E2 component (dihydrolipoamide acetyltransferase)